ncbi:MAG: DedA family protein [Deltaproteobacteria bacterium]|nr:DedA family protein [Deltaproteobacteria bacterium]
MNTETEKPPFGRFRVALLLALTGLLVLALALFIRMDGVVMLAQANRWMADTFIHRLGYLGVFILMTIESSFVPFPSEIVMPPAGDLARRLPDWSLGAVMFWGTAGSLAGALINYALARYLGRRLLLELIGRYGSFVRISTEGLFRSEEFFNRHGAISTFVGRLIPVIRQLISLPAGLARMNLTVFSLLTVLGAGIWMVILTLLGYWFGAEPELLSQALKKYSLWVLLAASALIGAYLALNFRRARLARKEGHG